MVAMYIKNWHSIRRKWWQGTINCFSCYQKEEETSGIIGEMFVKPCLTQAAPLILDHDRVTNLNK
jgi:hypothetical protein